MEDNPFGRPLAKTALQVLRGDRDETFERDVAELLDVEKFLTWNALVGIYGDPESDGFTGLSWYFDPVTGLLEPVVHSIDRPAGLPPRWRRCAAC